MAIYEYEVRRDYGRAHDAFSAAVRQSPNDARAYNYLALIERRQGRWEEAAAHFRQAGELDPENAFYLANGCSFLRGMGRFPELFAQIDHYLASHPAALGLHAVKASALLAWKADTRAARAELVLCPPGSDPGGRRIDVLLDCDCYERDFTAAERDLAACPSSEIEECWRAFDVGEIARRRGDEQAAVAAYTTARPLVEAKVRASRGNTGDLSGLAEVEAHLGHKEAALDEGRRMLSMATAGDTRQIPIHTLNWARILTYAGEREEAIRALQTICGQPYGPEYGDLHLNQDWNPLRSDPRFERMVASLGPR